MIEALLVMGVLAASLLGLKQWFAQQHQVLQQTQAQHDLAWQSEDAGWQANLYIPDAVQSAQQTRDQINRWLPIQGAQWAALQPAPHALSHLSSLKPFADLRGYSRDGLGMPVRVQP